MCQHGERECRGNLMQSCALSLLSPSGPKMEFVSCVMSSTDGSQEGKRVSFLRQTKRKPHNECFVLEFFNLLFLICRKLPWKDHETQKLKTEQEFLLKN